MANTLKYEELNWVYHKLKSRDIALIISFKAYGIEAKKQQYFLY